MHPLVFPNGLKLKVEEFRKHLLPDFLPTRYSYTVPEIVYYMYITSPNDDSFSTSSNNCCLITRLTRRLRRIVNIAINILCATQSLKIMKQLVNCFLPDSMYERCAITAFSWIQQVAVSMLPSYIDIQKMINQRQDRNECKVTGVEFFRRPKYHDLCVWHIFSLNFWTCLCIRLLFLSSSSCLHASCMVS